MDKGKELLRQEAFEHYYAQGLTGERSLKKTATELNVGWTTVKSWYKRDSWEQRIADRAAMVAQKVDAKVVEKVAEVKAEYHTMTRFILREWFKTHFGVPENSAIVLATMDADTIIKLVKLDLVLMGAPDAIKQIEGTVKHSLEDKLNSLSNEDLKAIVEARRVKKELPPAIEAEIVTPK